MLALSLIRLLGLELSLLALEDADETSNDDMGLLLLSPPALLISISDEGGGPSTLPTIIADQIGTQLIMRSAPYLTSTIYRK